MEQQNQDIHIEKRSEHLSYCHCAPDHLPGEKTEEETGSTFVRVAIIIGMLVILFFISIGIVRFVPKLLSGLGSASVTLSSIFNPKDDLEVSIDKKEIQSGDSFNVSWKNNTEDKEGYYTWSFKCTDGVKIEYTSTSGKKPVVCDTLFPLPENTSTYPFTITYDEKNGKISLPINITFWDKNTNKIKLTKSLSISVAPKTQNTSAATSTVNNLYPDVSLNQQTKETNVQATTTNTKKSSSQNTSAKNYNTGTVYGNSPDIAVTLVQIGHTSLSNGNFVANAYPTNGDKVLIKFRVANIGNGPSGTWTLRATLPTSILSERNYTSVIEPSLNPGNSYEMTLAFDNFDSSLNNIAIVVDTSSDVNISNNTLNIPIYPVVYNGNYNGNNYNYGYGLPDLSVRILDVNSNDNYIYNNYNTNSFGRYSKINVRFEVENLGGRDTGPWAFNTYFPATSNGNYYSPSEPSIAPGQKIQFTLSFDNPLAGNGTIQINADPNNNIQEVNDGNNSDSRSIYVNY